METAAQGGIDPISAITGVVGSIISYYNDGAEKEGYLARLNQQGIPQIRDWFAGYQTDFTKKNNQIIMLLVGVILVFGIAAIFMGSKKISF
jgi:hypothetical protein